MKSAEAKRQASNQAGAKREAGLWKRGLVWLLVLGPFFFISYGFANYITGLRPHIGIVVFDWEQSIPLWSWTIVPYWSIDLLYGLSFLLPFTRQEMDRHALRLLSVQRICVAGFLLWPLTMSFTRPELSGVFGWMFDVLMGFDKPFNQAPSLHIALLVVLWARFGAHTAPCLRPLLHLWFFLIGLSVLTTWQHHFIDVPTGALVGFFCLWLWPIHQACPLVHFKFTTTPQRRRLASRYLLGAVILLIIAITLGGMALWLSWPAISLLMVALNYGAVGAAGFQKQANGRLSGAALVLFAPYLAGAWLNSRLWTRRAPAPVLVADQVWLGRFPSNHDKASVAALMDLCAELPINTQEKPYYRVPILDLTTPSLAQCRVAGEHIAELRAHGSVLVYCALGYSRSASAVVAWLLLSGTCSTLEQAVVCVREARPGIVLTPEHLAVLSVLANEVSAIPPRLIAEYETNSEANNKGKSEGKARLNAD